MLAEAETKANAAHEVTLRRVLDEIAQLETSRDALRRDADALDRHVEAQRTRLTATIADLQRILVEPTRLQAPSAPVDVAPAVVDTPPKPVAPAAEVEVEEPVVTPRTETPRFVVAEEADIDDEAWARFGDAEADIVDEGPRTEPVLRLDRLERAEGDDDAYMSELRKAMLDDTGAPDADDGGYFDEADAGRAARTRFGRRR
jgi:hypothetical protein